MEPFTNEKRNRYYGKRVGDIIKSKAYEIEEAEVVEYGWIDNNAIVIFHNGKKQQVVAEWCDIVTKVEDR